MDAAVFDGTTGIRYGATNETIFHISAGYTVCAIAESTTNRVNSAIVQKNDSFTDGFGLGHGNTSANTDLWSGYYTNESTQFTPSLNTWFYVCGRYDGGVTQSIWNNGTKLADVANGAGTNNTSAKMAVGGIGNPYGWIGKIAWVIWWNVVVSDGDVALVNTQMHVVSGI